MFLRRYSKWAAQISRLLLCCTMVLPAKAQAPSFNFHQLGTSNGLSDPAVRNIVQDKYGYIWIGTANGLNRFNGYDVKVFQHAVGDSFSLQDNYVAALLPDEAGNLWIAQPKGIYRYDYFSNHFILQPGSSSISAYKMLAAGNNSIYLATTTGLVVFNIQTGAFTWLKNNADSNAAGLLGTSVNDFCADSKGQLYIATDTGLVKYNTQTGHSQKLLTEPLGNTFVNRITSDGAGNVWLSYGDNGLRLLKTNMDFKTHSIIEQFTLANTDLTDNRITAIFIDNRQRFWVATSSFGISLYDAVTNTFIPYRHDPLQVTSISDNLTNYLFQDRQGYLWVGTEVSGVNYFHPDKTFFRSIQPSYNQSPSLPDYWCRAAGEDDEGNLWLGTGKGIAKYVPAKNTYTVFQHTNDKTNALPYNSVRSVVCDGDWIWIGTGNGLNRYNKRTGKMEFFGEKDGVPVSFYWSMLKDHDNNVWFGTRDGIYRYNSHTHMMEDMRGDSVLHDFAANNTISMYEDSRQRLWFGFYSKGLLLYDPSIHKTKYWAKTNDGPHSLSDNHITSITEDKTGIIWAASLEGLNALDVQKNYITQYLRGNGQFSEKTACLITDDKNRLWLAGSRRLYMLDASRKFFTAFDMSDGLPSVDFNYQSAFRMKNGDFIYPTLRGFVQFNPAEYADKNHISGFYIASVKVYGKEPLTLINFEDRKDISLGADENFFSLDMIALNYGNPRETWYAHQLEPFDKEWVYSKGRTVNYTNVPGGDYIFHYKTSTDFNNWNVPEKTINIHLATVFYKTWWFRLLLILMLAALLMAIYKYRIVQKEKVFSLQSKANSLEKEKALVMYESLKQQLNPHFLFNSLTSLGGLIASNPQHARQFLDRMSKIYRYILKSRDNETVPLTEEIKLAETYTQLQQTRFKEGLQVDIDLPEEYLHRKIAPVTFQNLIENAIKHNIVDISRPLVVHISIQDDHIVIQNNLQKKKFVETSNRQGLTNLQSLYHYLSGKPVIIIENEHFFIVKIPLI